MVRRPLRLDRRLRIAAAILVAGSAGALLIAVQVVFDAGVAVTDATAAFLAFLAAGLCLRSGLRTGGRARNGWLLLGAGAAAWAIGELTWGFYEVALGDEAPFPSPADIAYLLGYPLILGGVLSLAIPPRGVARVRTMLDATVFVLVVAVPVWYYILEPVHSQSDASMLGKLLGDAYPAGDLILLFGITVAALRRWGERDGIILLVLGCGLVLFLASDLAFTLGSLEGTFETGSVIDAGWQAGYLLLALAAYLQARWQPDYINTDVARTSSAWRQAVPTASLVPLIVWFAFVARTGSGTGELVTSAIVCFIALLVALRSALNLSDILALNRTLATVQAGLEDANALLRARGREINALLMEAIDVARRDSLTGLLNHAAVLEEIARSLEGAAPVTVAILDVDEMKTINDSSGHLAGDALLKEVAQRLSSIPSTTAGRYGGDEFLAVTRGRRQGAAFASDVESALADLILDGAAAGGPVSVSVGFAVYPHDGATARTLINAADQRLYARKHARPPAPRSLTA